MEIVIDLSLSQHIPEYSGQFTRFCKVVKHKPVINKIKQNSP